MRSSTKCRKKRGEYCKIHNPQPAGFQEKDRRKFIMQGLAAYNERVSKGKKPLCAAEAEAIIAEREERAAKEAAKLKLEHDFRVQDMEKHLNLRVDAKTGEKTVSIFRAGIPSAPKERGVEKESYEKTDSFKPDGRTGRMNGIFASPTMNGVARWVNGVSIIVADYGVREIRVNPDKVYVYSVRAWEICSSRDSNEKDSKAYWDSGVTLTEWHEQLRQNPNLDPADWELLIGEENVKAVKPVGADRVSRSATSYTKGERDDSTYTLLTKGLGKKG